MASVESLVPCSVQGVRGLTADMTRQPDDYNCAHRPTHGYWSIHLSHCLSTADDDDAGKAVVRNIARGGPILPSPPFPFPSLTFLFLFSFPPLSHTFLFPNPRSSPGAQGGPVCNHVPEF